MIRTSALLVALVLFVGLSPAASAVDSLSASQIENVLARAYAAAGGEQLRHFVASISRGTLTQQGGGPSAFSQVLDLRNGYSRSELKIGPAVFVDGYDGVQWTARNGALSIVSLPPDVADAVTQAYLNRDAYFRRSERATIVSGRREILEGRAMDVLRVQPVGGSSAELYFDAKTYLLVRVVAEQSGGRDTTTFSNYQTIQGIPTAIKSVDVDPSGTTTVTMATSVHYATALDPAQLARPAYVSQGQLTAPVTVPFLSDDAGLMSHIVLPAMLGDANAQMIFDSGGANFLVAGRAKLLGIKTAGSFAVGGAGSKEQMGSEAALSFVDVAGAKLPNQNFIVLPSPYVLEHPRKGITVDGLIGYEYLANFRIAIRYAQHQMDIEPFDTPAPTGGVTLPFKSDGSHVYVLASVDGFQGYFLLDTGNAGGVDLNGPFVEQHHLFPNGGLTYVSPGGVGGTIPLTVTAAQSVQVAGIAFQDVPVTIAHTTAGAFAIRGVAGNFGARMLSRFTVVFDYKAQTVTFIPNADVHAPFAPDRTGLSINQAGPDAFEILAVVANSPASEAGIAAGDRITAVNGTPVSSGLGLGDFRPLTRGTAPFTVTLQRSADSSPRTVTITPRDILPPPQ